MSVHTILANGRRVRVEVFIDTGNGDANHTAFDTLRSERQRSDDSRGASLKWKVLAGRRGCCIARYRPGSFDDVDGYLDEYRSWVIERRQAIREVLGPMLRRMPYARATRPAMIALRRTADANPASSRNARSLRVDFHLTWWQGKSRTYFSYDGEHDHGSALPCFRARWFACGSRWMRLRFGAVGWRS